MDKFITHNGIDYVNASYLDIHLRLEAEELAGNDAEFLFTYVDWPTYAAYARMDWSHESLTLPRRVFETGTYDVDDECGDELVTEDYSRRA